jgi:mannose-6-phosphate isomerase-like protein (cupin superfamily)
MDQLSPAEAVIDSQSGGGEISHRPWQRRDAYDAGVIAFEPRPQPDARLICHTDRDVLCQVLAGEGRLRFDEQTEDVAVGTWYRIPAGVRHDFAASGDRPLVLFYVSIKVEPE